MRAPRTPGCAEQLLHQVVDRGHRDPVVGGQAAVTLGHDGPEAAEVAPGEESLGLVDAAALGDDVTGAPAQDGIGELAQVAERAGAERPPEDVGCPLALGSPGRVGRGVQEAGALAVHDHEGRLPGIGDLTGLEGREVDAERVAGQGGGDGERIEQAHVRDRAALGLLAGAGQGERVGVVPEREEERDGEGRARGQARSHRDGAGDPDAAARGWRLEPEQAGRQEGLGGHRRGGAQCDLERLVRELVGVDPDEEAARLGREGDLGGQVDGHGQREPAVVVGVVADDGDASGARAVGTAPACRSPPRPASSPGCSPAPGLTAPCSPGHDPAMVERVRSGPLSGIKIIELAGIGPAPYTCMMLADAGAQVLRLERAPAGAVEAGEEFANSGAGSYWDLLNRSRPSVGIDLKNPDAVELVLGLVERADGLIEGFRPGVAERLGVGPETASTRNQRLVYGRMTGWGQDGPMASMAGHDIDYIAIGGALWSLGRADTAPVPPLNLVGDFGGGGMLLAFGMVVRRCSRPPAPVRDRSSTPPWSTARRR